MLTERGEIMENNVNKTNSRIKSYTIIFCLIVAMMTLTVVPAFAYTFDEYSGGRHFTCVVGDTFTSYQTASPVYLYVDIDTPITIRLLKDHPEYFVKLRDTLSSSVTSVDFNLYLSKVPSNSERIFIGFDHEPIDIQYDNLVFVASEKGINLDDYLDYYVSVEANTSSMTTYRVEEVGEFIVPPPPPPSPIEQIQFAATSASTMIGSTIGSFFEVVTKNPLLLIVYGISFVAIGYAFGRSFLRV